MFGKQSLAINWSRSSLRAALAAGSAVILIVAFMHSAASASSEDEEDLLREVLADAAGHDQAGWAYTRVLLVKVGTVSEREKLSITEKFDPSKPPGEQRQRVEIREDENGRITTEFDDDIDVDVDRAVYEDLSEIEFESAELVSENEDELVYRLEKKDGEEFRFGGASIGGDSLMDAVYGELVIRKSGPSAPYVSEVRLRNRDVGGSLLADIEKLNISYRFAPSPDGTTYLSQGLDLEVQVEVLIFIDIYVDIESEYTDYRYVGEYDS